jgi:hypothetical protein
VLAFLRALLTGDRTIAGVLMALATAERCSIRVTGNWRITFGWNGTDAVAVDLENYHR